MPLSGRRTRLAVLGHPIAHSRSPAMQVAALRTLGLEDWSYEAIDVPPEHLAERVRAMADEGFAGANVTIPHKEAALALSDEASERARAIGAANTLSFAEGRIRAENTDAPGLIAALPGSARGARTVVLGAGGAARAAVWALAGAGASVVVTNRGRERAERLVAELGGELHRGGPLPLSELDLVVNATSIGLRGGDHDPGGELAALKEIGLEVDQLSDRTTVVDLVYVSGGTGLVGAGMKAGATVVDGLEILVRQGAASLEIWTGHEAPLEAMRAAANAADLR